MPRRLATGTATAVLLALLVIATARLAAAPGPAPVASVAAAPSDEAAVRATLEHYIQGHATGDAAHWRAAFHPDAKILFVRDGALTQWTTEEYFARAPGKPAPDEARRRRRIASVDIVGSAASAKIELDYPEVRFTDYMALLKVGGEWKIVNKTFHAERPAAP